MSIIINGQSGIDMGGKPLSNETSVHEAVSKTTPVDADEIGILDSASNFGLKKFTWSNLKATLSSLFVSKVTSTDNAVVRFDGTSGAVQNSGVVIDDSGNVGIVTAPSAWNIGASIDISKNCAVYGDGQDYTWDVGIVQNGYQTSANAWKYKSASNQTAGMYRINGNQHEWKTAPLGSAGNSIPWTNAMTLIANGNLLIGTTTDNGVDKLQVNGSISSGTIMIYPNGDLNNFKYITQTVGTYPNGYMSNLPINDHGYLEIIVYSANVFVMQRFTTLGVIQTAGRVFVRCLSDGVWSAWTEK